MNGKKAVVDSPLFLIVDSSDQLLKGLPGNQWSGILDPIQCLPIIDSQISELKLPELLPCQDQLIE